jgi:hypothetical protein
MIKNVTSKDPRKAAIVASLKSISGATKVTLLKEHVKGDLHYFAGSCLKRRPRAVMVPTGLFYSNGSPIELWSLWENVGTFSVDANTLERI